MQGTDGNSVRGINEGRDGELEGWRKGKRPGGKGGQDKWWEMGQEEWGVRGCDKWREEGGTKRNGG